MAALPPPPPPPPPPDYLFASAVAVPPPSAVPVEEALRLLISVARSSLASRHRLLEVGGRGNLLHYASFGIRRRRNVAENVSLISLLVKSIKESDVGATIAVELSSILGERAGGGSGESSSSGIDAAIIEAMHSVSKFLKGDEKEVLVRRIVAAGHEVRDAVGLPEIDLHSKTALFFVVGGVDILSMSADTTRMSTAAMVHALSATARKGVGRQQDDGDVTSVARLHIIQCLVLLTARDGADVAFDELALQALRGASDGHDGAACKVVADILMDRFS